MSATLETYDYIVIGSGFGGSVAALRLSEKGYKVLVIEKGKWFESEDFPKRNWNLRKWLWLPFLHFYGFFKITFFRHLTALSGVGVGGGSLVYANTLPIPKKEFFESGNWSGLADWKKELMPFYHKALEMMGATQNPNLADGDAALKTLAQKHYSIKAFSTADVAVFFGEAEVETDDPFFNGKGPRRCGCTYCGGCMVGCRYNAKNTLDKNYLYLAQNNGVKIMAESQVYDIRIEGETDKGAYRIFWKKSIGFLPKRGELKTKSVVFSGGVLGTVSLLLNLKEKSLPGLSDKIGENVRTNSESLLGVTTTHKKYEFSKGVAIGSILNTDEHSHLEPVRYPSGSGFWRLLMSPLVHGDTVFLRIYRILSDIAKHPLKNIKTYFVPDWARQTQILLFMRTIDSKLKLQKSRYGLRTKISSGKAPTAFLPEAKKLAEQYAEIVKGKPTALLTESLLGIPTTAHILGGAVMGRNKEEGVIDKDNKVFGYDNMFICDGSMISANPGVNPSLSILAVSERAMSKIPHKNSLSAHSEKNRDKKK